MKHLRMNGMNSSEIDVALPRGLQSTLRKITERLAGELASPRDDAPGWTAFEWQLARAVAALHGVSPLLASRLKWDGPPGWKAFLQAQRAHVAARQQYIEEFGTAYTAGLPDSINGQAPNGNPPPPPPPPPPPSCQYNCSDYGFSANQCYQGWQCDAAGMCLTATADGTCPM